MREGRNKKQDNIQLLSCPQGGNNCMDLLKRINDYLFEANQHRMNKNYIQALKLKDRAFKETIILEGEHCFPCADLFRKFILNSVSEYISELDKMSRGFLKRRRFYEQRMLAVEYRKSMEQYIRNIDI